MNWRDAIGDVPPHARDLPARHPHLCVGEGREAFLRQPYCSVRCPVCDRYPVDGHPVPGGGRVGRHYRPDIHAAYLAWFDTPPNDRVWPPGQLALGDDR